MPAPELAVCRESEGAVGPERAPRTFGAFSRKPTGVLGKRFGSWLQAAPRCVVGQGEGFDEVEEFVEGLERPKFSK